MSVLLVFTIACKTSDALTDLEAMCVNVLVAMNCQMEIVKVIKPAIYVVHYFICIGEAILFMLSVQEN